MTDPISLNLAPASAPASKGINDAEAAAGAGAAFDAVLEAQVAANGPVAVAGNLPETGNPLPADRKAAIAGEADGSDGASDGTSNGKADSDNDNEGGEQAGVSPVAMLLVAPLIQPLAQPLTVQVEHAATPVDAGKGSARNSGAVRVAGQPVVTVPAAPAAPTVQAAAEAQVQAQVQALPGTVVKMAVTGAKDAPGKATDAPRKDALSPNMPSISDSILAANAESSASPSGQSFTGQGDAGQGQPPMAEKPATLPAGPSPIVSPEATNGPAIPAPTLAINTVAPAVPAAASHAGHDMTALVDRLVEARAAARGSAGVTTVSTSLRHAEFGQVSLRFETRGDGLSVSMASSDPAFAGAAQAALAARGVDAAQAGSDARQQQGHSPPQQPGGSQPQQQFGHQQSRPQGQFAPTGMAVAARAAADSNNAGDDAPEQAGVFA